MSRLLHQRTYHFRNLVAAEHDFDAPEVVLSGANGQGKTNFLESVYVLCRANTFRSRKIEELCKVGETTFSLSGRFSSDISISFSLEGKKRTLELNQKVLKDRRVLIEKLGCIAFVHEDIQYIVGAPEFRRRYLDQCLSMIDSLYLDHLRAYKRLFQNRNVVLRSKDVTLLDVLDLQLAEYGAKIMRARDSFVASIAPTVIQLFQEVSGLSVPMKVSYRASWDTDQEEHIVAHLNTLRERELLLGMTLTGPHRDRVEVSMMEHPFVSLASTGQVRLLSLILKIVQAQISNEIFSGGSILLFDDVLLELDADYKNRFASVIPPYAQAFFTFLVGEHFQQFYTDCTKYYTVKEGSLHEGYAKSS